MQPNANGHSEPDQAPRDLFPPSMSAEQIVRCVMIILRAYHERQTEHLNQILSDLSTLPIQRMATGWQQLKNQGIGDEASLHLLTQAIATDVDGGDGPILPLRF